MLSSPKQLLGNHVFRQTSPIAWLPVLTIALLVGCATQPEPEPRPVVEVLPPQPLSLPESTVQSQSCDCQEIAAQSVNDFDLGVRALAARDYRAAQVLFERHRRTGTPEAQREADVGIAFVALMSDAKVAQGQGNSDGDSVDERAAVMVLALAAVETLERRIDALDALNEVLSKDLRKREEALKRLRDLTLGQQEEPR